MASNKVRNRLADLVLEYGEACLSVKRADTACEARVKKVSGLIDGDATFDNLYAAYSKAHGKKYRLLCRLTKLAIAAAKKAR